MRDRTRRISHKVVVIGLLALILLAGDALAASRIKRAIIGTVQTVDKTAKTIVVKTANGTVETIKWTGKTTVSGLAHGAKAADFVGRDGTYVVVHYTVKGAKQTAIALEDIGKEAPKIAVGTLKATGSGARKLAILTADGSEEVFDLSKNAMVYTGTGVSHAAAFTAKKAAASAKITIHYTELGGRKVAHLIRRM